MLAVLASALVALVALGALATLGLVLAILALAALGLVLLVTTSLVHVIGHFILEHEIIFLHRGEVGEGWHTRRCRNSLHFEFSVHPGVQDGKIQSSEPGRSVRSILMGLVSFEGDILPPRVTVISILIRSITSQFLNPFK